MVKFCFAFLLGAACANAQITQNFEIYDPASDTELLEIKNMGFTQVVLDKPWLSHKAAELGLKVVLGNWWNLETPEEEIRKSMEFARTIKRLAFVSLMDKPDFTHRPDLHPSGFYVRLSERLRASFPEIKLSISHWGPLRKWPKDWPEMQYFEAFKDYYTSLDEIRIMPSPVLSGDPLSETYFMMVRSRRLMKLANKKSTLNVCLQTWTESNEDPIPLLPTIVQLRVMAYLVMLSEADTLSFFDYQPRVWKRVPGYSEGFASLMDELTGLAKKYREFTIQARMLSNQVVFQAELSLSQLRSCIRINSSPFRIGDLLPLEIRETSKPCEFF